MDSPLGAIPLFRSPVWHSGGGPVHLSSVSHSSTVPDPFCSDSGRRSSYLHGHLELVEVSLLFTHQSSRCFCCCLNSYKLLLGRICSLQPNGRHNCDAVSFYNGVPSHFLWIPFALQETELHIWEHTCIYMHGFSPDSLLLALLPTGHLRPTGSKGT